MYKCFAPILLLLPLLCTCGLAKEDTERERGEALTRREVSGEAMGSYYRITYLGDSIPGLRFSVDSLLDAYNLELSAWVPTSKLSEFNQSVEGVDLNGTLHFIPNLELARGVSAATGGAYDPTIGPLVNYWGFGTGVKRTTKDDDPREIAELLKLVGWDNIRLEGSRLLKTRPGVQLDLNASAKGYGVDLLADLLEERGRPNHLIDIGGEMRGGGSKDGTPWRVAIRLPDEDRSRVTQGGTLPLEAGRALATSGNYLNYYRVDGETYSHTIDPRSGRVERNRLLSASIMAPSCALADAYATACMVLGPSAALELIENTEGLEGYFLVRAEDGEALDILKTSGIED